ncbi:hypothetical protein J6590_041263 [Homalodisca vitripennis]|nr:hypothetical protein J6590_041263 [Homalodisca vitripennis]
MGNEASETHVHKVSNIPKKLLGVQALSLYEHKSRVRETQSHITPTRMKHGTVTRCTDECCYLAANCQTVLTTDKHRTFLVLSVATFWREK